MSRLADLEVGIKDSVEESAFARDAFAYLKTSNRKTFVAHPEVMLVEGN
jgi:hypothetical protein